MIVLQTIAVAFAMFSAVPVPQFAWNEKNMRYALCAFPLVGLLCGALWCVCGVLPLPAPARAAGFCLVPVWVTGGIHLDGLLDTADALSSWQTRERRLEILKDSHAGAFALIVCCGYFLAAFGIWTEAGAEDIGVLAVGFILSRALNGFGICTFPCAKNSGLAATFAQAADRKRCQIVLVIEILLCIAGMLLIDPLRGTTAAVAAVVVCLCCRRMAIKTFGGITGDIQGFFLQICELAMAYVVILQ